MSSIKVSQGGLLNADFNYAFIEPFGVYELVLLKTCKRLTVAIRGDRASRDDYIPNFGTSDRLFTIEFLFV